MNVRSISVVRVGDYGYGRMDPSKPFQCTVTVEGQAGKIELALSPDLSKAVVDIIAGGLVAASRATAEAMTAEIFTVQPTAIAAPEAVQ